MQLRPLLLLAALPVTLLALAAARPEDKKFDANGAYGVDPVHSTVIFKCLHAGTSWAFGRFDDVAGSLHFDGGAPDKSHVEITIQAKSVNTNAKDRDDHLRGPDFFDVKQFPTATFKSTKIEKKGDKTYAVTGDLSLHGTKKQVTIDMQHTGSVDAPPPLGKRIGFYGTMTLKRADFGMTYGEGMLGAEVELMLSIEGLAK